MPDEETRTRIVIGMAFGLTAVTLGMLSLVALAVAIWRLFE